MKKYSVFIQKITVTAILFAIMLLSASCGSNSDNGEIASSNFEMNWSSVNQAIEAADLSQYGYYMEKDYQTTEQELNYVSLYNYNPNDMNAWKKTDYQLDISYGQNFKVSGNGMYEEATIEISIIQTNGDGCYSASYTPEGKFIEENGDWFITDKKEDYLSKSVAQAREIFGIT